jgi:hypothetical protein
VRSLPAVTVTDPFLRARLRGARVRLGLALLGFPGLAVLLCAGMVASGRWSAWAGLPVLGALAPALVGGLVTIAPPRWMVAVFGIGAAQFVFGVLPSYAMAGGTSVAAVLFGVFWPAYVVGIGLAYSSLGRPLIPALGDIGLEIRLGARYAVLRPDRIILGVTVGREHLAVYARRHGPLVRGLSEGGFSVPLRAVRGVRVVLLGESAPWFALSDGTPLLTTPGPAVAVAGPHGDLLVPTDEAAALAELVDRRVRFAHVVR